MEFQKLVHASRFTKHPMKMRFVNSTHPPKKDPFLEGDRAHETGPKNADF
jgi:hypothetical protein